MTFQPASPDKSHLIAVSTNAMIIVMTMEQATPREPVVRPAHALALVFGQQIHTKL
jgi:hypothetical protein